MCFPPKWGHMYHKHARRINCTDGVCRRADVFEIQQKEKKNIGEVQQVEQEGNGGEEVSC